MAEAGGQTVAEFLKHGRLSSKVARAVRHMTPSRHFENTGDISSFLEEVLRVGRQVPGSSEGWFFETLARQTGEENLVGVLRQREKAAPGMQMSEGLAAAFAAAFQARETAGGNDDWIGMRHILIAILANPSSAVIEERALAVGVIGRLDLDALAVEFARDVLKTTREPTENLTIWADYLREWGRPAAADVLSPKTPAPGAPPKAPRKRAHRAKTPATPPPPPYVGDLVPGFWNDNPEGMPADERIGDDGAAKALARIIASGEFRPPLAVGIFGAWGSGKSFLMHRVEEEIDRLGQTNRPGFLTRVLKVRFNAWHYVDTDLWASLVGEIFETLETALSPRAERSGGVLDKLTTARELTLAAARDLATRRLAADKARQALAAAHKERDRVRSGLAVQMRAMIESVAALGALKTDSSVSKLVEGVYGKPLEEMATEWREPAAAVEAMRRDGLVALSIRRDLGSWPAVLAFVALGVGLFSLPVWGPVVIPSLAGLVERVSPVALTAAGLLTSAAGWTAVATRKAVVARDAVVKAMAAYRKTIDEAGDGEGINVEQTRLDAAEVKVRESQATLSAAIAHQAEASGAFARSTPIERLKSFVRDKASRDGPYRSRQGLISVIRRDFSDLAALMADDGEVQQEALEAVNTSLDRAIEGLNAEFNGVLTPEELAAIRGEEPANAAPAGFDRIVLYIDDLDRCSAEKVVEVLQAVHLLMAFRLFVVVVAVDVRWLKGSLNEHYAQFRPENDRPAPIEYLEKIFQLAVWTQPFNEPDAGAFLARRLQPRVPEVAPGLPEGRGQPADDPPPQDSGGKGGSAGLKVEPVEGAETLPVDPGTGKRPSGPADAVDAAQILSLPGDEIAWLEAICGSVPMTPRRLLRLSNTYLVARASLGEDATSRFADGGYKPFAALLTALIAWPEQTHDLLTAITTSSGWDDVKASLSSDARDAGRHQLELWCDTLAEGGVTVTELARYVPLAVRFSFAGPQP